MECRQDALDDSLDVFIELRIVEANDTIAARSKKCSPPSVVCDLGGARMSFAIDFHDQAALTTEEIGKVGADWCLSNEFESAERPILKPLP